MPNRDLIIDMRKYLFGRLAVLAVGTVIGMPAVAGAQALAPQAEAEGAAPGLEETRPGTPITAGKSAYGRFLAGRHAEALRENRRAADYLGGVLDVAPDNPPLMRRTMLLYLSDGRVDKATELAGRLVAFEPNETTALLLLALGDLTTGATDRAMERLDAMPQSGPSRILVPILQAWTTLAAGDPQAAVEQIRASSALSRLGPLLEFHVALLAEVGGLDQTAEAAYLALAGDRPELTLKSVLAFGGFLNRTERADQARALMNAYLETNPDSMAGASIIAKLDAGERWPAPVDSTATGLAEVLYTMANLLTREGASNAALQYCRLALHLRPDDALTKLLLADIYVSQDRNADAVEALQTIVPDSPYRWLSRLSIANNLAQLENYDEAVVLLREMSDEAPRRFDATQALADLLRQTERYEDAVPAYDQAIDRAAAAQSSQWRLLYGRGIALERTQQWDRAEADFLAALELEPDQPFVLNYLGYSWIEKGLNLDRARDMIETAVRLRPRDGYIVDSLGWVLFQLGDYDGAVRQLERAVELRPNDPVINDHLGDAFWLAGRAHEARFQWRRALGFDPEEDARALIEGKLEGRELPQPAKKSDRDI